MTTSTHMMKLAAAALVMASMAACTPKRAVEPAVPNTPTAPSNPIYPTPNGNVGGDTLGSARPGSEQDFVVNVGDRVYFELDSYTVSSEAFPRLDAQAQWLARYPQITVRIEGNADERGTREYNLALGARRAESVRNALIQRGVSAARIDTISFGKERPIAEGSTEDSWARNRNGHTAIVSGAQ